MMVSAELATVRMVVHAARLLRDDDVVLVGVGLPNLAANLAQRTRAPGLTLVYEAGVFGSRPGRLPLSIGDPALVSGALAVSSMYEMFAFYLQRGWITVGFLGGAQIDRFGNVNATVIGDYRKPKVRLPGSGGSMEIAAWAGRCVLMAPHQARRFPERCDFRTSAGFLNGAAERAERGLLGKGPAAVVTDLGILEPDESGELVLTALHAGVTMEQAQARTGWALRASRNVAVTDLPTEAELRVLETLDPQGIYLNPEGAA